MYPIIAVIIAIALEGIIAFTDISQLARKSISPITKWFIILFILGHNILSSLVCWMLIAVNVNPILLIFAVGLGLPILLKSKIFVIKSDGVEIPVGFEFIYQNILDFMKKQISRADLLAKITLYVRKSFSDETISDSIQQLIESTELPQKKKELHKAYDAAMKMKSEADKRMALISVLAKYGSKKYVDRILMSAEGGS